MIQRAPKILVAGAMLLGVASLGGCASSTKMTYLPSGDTGFAIKCNNDHGISPDGKTIVISDQSQPKEHSAWPPPHTLSRRCRLSARTSPHGLSQFPS